MKKILFLCLAVFCALENALGQIPFEHLKMGASAKVWEGKTHDVSNPQSWEETCFELQESVALFGKISSGSSKVRLTFWNDRLYSVGMTFPESDWSEIATILHREYGSAWKIDSVKKEGYWGESGGRGAVVYLQSSGHITLTIYDEAQKNFQWRDIFRGVLLYIILAIVGLFVAYFLVVHLLTSFCPRCKSFAMELQEGVQQSNPQTYRTDAALFSTPTIEYDRTYTHKCTKCGYERRDTYSGWWESYRKTHKRA